MYGSWTECLEVRSQWRREDPQEKVGRLQIDTEIDLTTSPAKNVRLVTGIDWDSCILSHSQSSVES